jgi:DNA mismatch endonuclease (patch repair protein)
MKVFYRLCAETLPGKPDISNQTHGWCIFVHGCFWHAHRNCRIYIVPRRNREWWVAKLERNRARDQTNVRRLRRMGFRVLVVWECQAKDLHKLLARLDRFFAA